MLTSYNSFCLYLVLNFYTVYGQGCVTYPAGVLGSCISIQDCPRLNSLLQQARAGHTDGTLNVIRRSLCSLRPPTACCEPAVTPAPTPAPSASDPSSVLPSNCGKRPLEDFVVGGEKANWWPWMVLFKGRSRQGTTSFFFCGGTLITDRFVLTAAHCITPKIILESAQIGELIISSNPDTYKGLSAPPVQEIPVAQVISHPQYQQSCPTCNDIAIVKLARTVTTHSGFVSPICLPVQPEQQMGFSVSQFQGKLAKAAGWGTSNLNDSSRSSIPDHLQQAGLIIEKTQFCQKYTSDHPVGSTLCAGSGDGKDTCKGDSGGPLMLTNAVGNRYFLVGLTSFGPTACGAQDTQGVYTSVHHYLPWILQNISNSSATLIGTVGNAITFES